MGFIIRTLNQYLIVLKLFPAATFGLGVWQIKRKIWKEQLIANLKSQMSKEPVDLPEEFVATDIFIIRLSCIHKLVI